MQPETTKWWKGWKWKKRMKKKKKIGGEWDDDAASLHIVGDWIGEFEWIWEGEEGWGCADRKAIPSNTTAKGGGGDVFWVDFVDCMIGGGGEENKDRETVLNKMNLIYCISSLLW